MSALDDGGKDAFRRRPRSGPVEALAAAIEAWTGSPAPIPEEAFRAALTAAFPDLPRADAIEGCTTHPALLVRYRVAGLGRESVKVVLVPRRDCLELRVRLEIPGGSYRQETLRRILAGGEAVERALGASGEEPVR